MSDPESGSRKQRQCTGERKDGQRCTAPAMSGGLYCTAHDPAKVADMAVWRRQGGHQRSNAARARKRLTGDVRDMADVKARLMRALEKVENGTIEPAVATAMANLARAITTVAGVADFETQLVDMREQLAELSPRSAS